MSSSEKEPAPPTALPEEQMSLARHIVYVLMGAGGFGLAMAVIGKEGFQVYGLLALVVCVVVASALAVLEGKERRDRDEQERQERREQREREERLERERRDWEDRHRREEWEREDLLRREGLGLLNAYYVDSMNTVGEFLARGRPEDSRVLRTLSKDLRAWAEGQQVGSQELLQYFRAGIACIADRWAALAEQGTPEVVSPQQELEGG